MGKDRYTWGLLAALATVGLSACGGDDGPVAVKKVTVTSDSAVTSDADADAAGPADTASAADGGGQDAAAPTDATATTDATPAADATTATDAASSSDGSAQGDAAADASAGDAGAAGDTAQSCSGPKGCFSCPPKANKELLNQCNSNSCAGFDNTKRLPLLPTNGVLPPLP